MSQSTNVNFPLDPKRIDLDAFSRALRSALFQKNLTQKELAQRVNVSQPTVSGWTNGHKRPGRHNLKAVAEELGLNLTEVAASQPSTSESQMRVLPFLTTAPPPARERSIPGSSSNSEEGRTEPVRKQAEEETGRMGRPATRGAQRHRSWGAPGATSRKGKRETSDAAPDDITDSGLGSARLDRVDGVRTACHVSLSAGLFPDPPHQTAALAMIAVTGDAMAPDLPDGSRIVFHSEDLTDSDRYVIFDGRTLMVRAIQVFNGGAIKLQPLNPAYDSELFLPMSEPDMYCSERTGLTSRLCVLGPVVLTIRAT